MTPTEKHPRCTNLLGKQLEAVVGEAEALLHLGGELADAAALLAEHVLRARGQDDDLRPRRCHTHLHARVTAQRERRERRREEEAGERTISGMHAEREWRRTHPRPARA